MRETVLHLRRQVDLRPVAGGIVFAGTLFDGDIADLVQAERITGALDGPAGLQGTLDGFQGHDEARVALVLGMALEELHERVGVVHLGPAFSETV